MKTENAMQWKMARQAIQAIRKGMIKHTDLLCLPNDVLKKIERRLNRENLWELW